MKEAIRIISFVMGCIIAVTSVIMFFVWFNNLNIALQWDPKNGHEADYSGPIPSFDKFAVDFTTVSTFIVLLGCFLISVGFLRTSMSGNRCSAYFPFFKSYNQLNIALGLVGTVFGLIMISYYPPDDVDMARLVICLKTALYSTLVALVWVFVIAAPVKFVMQRWHRYVTGCVDGDGTNILQLIQKMGDEASRAVQGIRGLGNAAIASSNGLKGTSEVINRLRVGIESLSANVNAMVQGMKQEHVETLKLINYQQKVVSTQMAMLKRLEKKSEKLKRAGEKAEKRVVDIEVTARKIRAQREDAQGRALAAEQERNGVVEKLVRIRELVKSDKN